MVALKLAAVRSVLSVSGEAELMVLLLLPVVLLVSSLVAVMKCKSRLGRSVQSIRNNSELPMLDISVPLTGCSRIIIEVVDDMTFAAMG